MMIENSTIEHINFTETALDDEYYNCEFISCDFSNRTIDATLFEKCTFKSCNFSLVRFKKAMRNIHFIDCKLMGADLTGLGKFSAGLSFESSLLNYANFVGTKLQKTRFTHCSLLEAYFDDADLKLSTFDQCDLLRASFHGANLEKVDFSTAVNFSIDPTNCRLKEAVFSNQELRGLVAHLDIIIKP